MNLFRLRTLLLVSAVLIALGCAGGVIRKPEPAVEDGGGLFSPVGLAVGEDSGTLYVAGYTAHRIAVCDMNRNTVFKTIELPVGSSGLVLSRHGTQLYITGGSPNGRVFIYSIYLDSIVVDIPVGHTPMSPVLSPNGRLLYVCNRFDNDVSVVDITAQREEYRIPSNTKIQAITGTTLETVGRNDQGDAATPGTSYGTPSSAAGPDSGKKSAPVPELREPVSAAITPDGKLLFVANLLPPPGGVAGGVSVIDTAERRVVAFITLPNGSSGLRGICVSPDGAYVYVTHILARYHVPTTQLDRGWMNTNALSIIDAGGQKLSSTVLLDDVDRGAANPWGVACSADGTRLYVTHAGTHELSIIDRIGLHKKLRSSGAVYGFLNTSSSQADVVNDLSFSTGLRRLVQLHGIGPRAVIAAGTTAIVADYFSDQVEVVDSGPSGCDSHIMASLSSGEPLLAERRGELLFNDARFCFQQWQSCASCHPDGRMDGLTWDLLNDGVGNPKSTKSLLLSHRTPPVMVTGVRANAETAVRAGMKFIEFVMRAEEDAASIDAYLTSLKPVPSPRLVDGKLSLSARRGEKIFSKAGCARCHPAPLFTDLHPYDVGTGFDREFGITFDTPTLMEVWRTAPYLYDGRAATMKDVLTKYNVGDFHGITFGLSSEDLADLIEYILSL